MKVLAVGDIHAPATHPGYPQFCKDLYVKWDCDTVVFIGDVIDFQAISFHANNPNCPGADDEYVLARQQIQAWKRTFPVANVCIGNHDERVLRLAESVNIPARFIRDYSETWGTPGWNWKHEHILDGVYYFHGTGQGGVHPAWCASGKLLMPVVMGHCHSRSGVKWRANPMRRIFSVDVGCVDADTEYLSPLGWKRIADYDGSNVAQYSDDGSVSWVQPLQYIQRPSGGMFHLKTKYGVNQVVSPDHRVVYEDQHGNLAVKSADEVVAQHERDSNGFRGRFITTFRPSIGSCSWTEASLRLQVAFLADGTLGDGYPRIHVKKARKKERIERLLRSAGVYFKRSDYKNGCSNFWFAPPCATKHVPNSWWQASESQLRVIADESLLWDGNQRNMFDSAKKEIADFIQYAFAASGRRARIIQGHGTHRVCVALTQSRASLASTCKQSIERVNPADGMEYCFTVPSGMLLLRRGGCIFVTGNCGIDVDAYQFAYGKHQKERPILSAAVILDGVPYHEIMQCDRKERYHKSRFQLKKKRKTT